MGNARRESRWSRVVALGLATALAGPALGARAQDDPAPQGGAPGGEQPSQDQPAQPNAASYVPQTQNEAQLAQIFGDHHVAVVGAHVITRAEVIGLLRDKRLEDDPTEGRTDLTEQEVLQVQFSAALEQIIDEQLKVQGGRIMGFDPDLVRRLVEQQFQRWVEREGGPQRATEQLASFRFSPARFKEFLKERTLARTWEETMDGRGLGSSGRKAVDNYIRPGELEAYYRNYLASADAELQKVVGLSKGSISIQQLLVAVPAPGEQEATRQRMEAYRDNLVSGVLDFDTLVNTSGAARSRGETSYSRDLDPALVLGELAKIHPGQKVELGEFLEGPAPGDISPVCAIEVNGVIEGYSLYRIVAWEGPSPPLPFVSLELQTALENEIKEQEAEVRVNRALARLARTTHVAPDWVRQALIGRGQSQARGRTRANRTRPGSGGRRPAARTSGGSTQ